MNEVGVGRSGKSLTAAEAPLTPLIQLALNIFGGGRFTTLKTAFIGGRKSIPVLSFRMSVLALKPLFSRSSKRVIGKSCGT